MDAGPFNEKNWQRVERTPITLGLDIKIAVSLAHHLLLCVVLLCLGVIKFIKQDVMDRARRVFDEESPCRRPPPFPPMSPPLKTVASVWLNSVRANSVGGGGHFTTANEARKMSSDNKPK